MTVYVHCRYTSGYCAIQNDLKELYSSLQDFVVKQEFKTHIQEDAFGMENIEGKLTQHKDDVMKTECPIVIAGETYFHYYWKQEGHNNAYIFCWPLKKTHVLFIFLFLRKLFHYTLVWYGMIWDENVQFIISNSIVYFTNQNIDIKDSLTCQFKGYGTQMTVKAWGPIVGTWYGIFSMHHMLHV